jgi:SOS-response transcriptional repressor LexA
MGNVDKKAFGARVAQRRMKLGLSQQALADLVGMRQQGIVSIEAGHVERPRLLRELAAALHTSDAWLLWRDGHEEVAPGEAIPLARVPLLDWVSAGRLVPPTSQIPLEDVPLLAFADLGRGEFFALRVEGDSMDRLSPDGSTIVVNKTERELLNGRAYVFSVRGETTYKLWHDDPAFLQPFSTNPIHMPIFFKRKKDFEVIGRVRRTMLDLERWAANSEPARNRFLS